MLTVTKCCVCKIHKDEDEVDFCEHCQLYTCFDCQTTVHQGLELKVICGNCESEND